MIGGFRRLYGAGPLHLLAHAGAFFIAGWAIAQILRAGHVLDWIVWFVGAALLHDLVLVPLYSLLDGTMAGTPRRRRAPRGRSARNHLRLPAAICGLLILVYFPLILGYSSSSYIHDSGHMLTGYTRNWLLICAGLFLASALLYTVRRLARHRGR